MPQKIYYQKKKPVGYVWKKKVSKDAGEAVILGTFVVALVTITVVYWNYQKNLKIGKKYNTLQKNKNMIGEENMAICKGTPRKLYYQRDKIDTSDLDIITNYPQRQQVIYA